MSIDPNASTKPGLSVSALILGLFALVVLLVAVGGFGIGTPELVIWLVLVAGWVSFWMRKRRR